MKRDYSQQLGQRIAIHGKSKTEYLNVKDITHIESEDAIVTTHTADTCVSATKQLKEFEDELSDLGFIRINRSTIINRAHIKSYTGGDKKKVELANGEEFLVSRRKAHLFK